MKKSVLFIIALLLIGSSLGLAAKAKGLPKEILVIEQADRGDLLSITAIDLSNNEIVIITYTRQRGGSAPNYFYSSLTFHEITRTGIKADPGHYFNRK